MATLISVLTNQFFLIFLAIALGLALGKIKIGNFSLGVSGGIFSGIVIGFIAQTWAKGVQEGELGYSSATSVLKTGVVSQSVLYILSDAVPCLHRHEGGQRNWCNLQKIWHQICYHRCDDPCYFDDRLAGCVSFRSEGKSFCY